MVAPTVSLWLYIIALAVLYSGFGPELPKRSDLISSFLLPFLLAWWVVADARKRERKLCYDFDSFVFFLWPVIVPVYLFQSRGLRAFLTLLCFVGMIVVGMLASVLLFFLREGLR
jgi:hypothetical protein